MKVDWQILWAEFDVWWEKHEENFENTNSARWSYQAKAIQVLVNAKLMPEPLNQTAWSRIFNTLTEWWKTQKTSYTPWCPNQKRKIQQIINKEIDNAS